MGIADIPLDGGRNVRVGVTFPTFTGGQKYGSQPFARSAFTFVTIAALFSAGRPAVAGTYHDPSNGFSVDAPAGWTEISPETLTRFVATVTKPGVTPPDYVTGFASAADGSMRFPYVLVQAMPQRVSMAQVQSQLTNVKQSDLKLTESLNPEVMKRVTLSADPQATVNAADHTFTMNMQINTPVGPPIHCATFGFVGQNGVINVHCYDAVDHFAATAPAFQSTVASFRFDPGQEYSTSTNEPGLSPIATKAMAGGVIGTVVGGIAMARRKAKG